MDERLTIYHDQINFQKKNSQIKQKKTHLPTPAIPHDRPLLNPPAFPQLLHDLRDARQRLGRRGFRLEELAEFLAFLLVVWRVPGDVCGLALEEVGDENLVLCRVGVGEDVSALESLVEEAEDVIDDEDAGLCVFGAGGV